MPPVAEARSSGLLPSDTAAASSRHALREPARASARDLPGRVLMRTSVIVETPVEAEAAIGRDQLVHHQGFAMDDERLKRGGSVLSDRCFEEQLLRVREIRLSERKFYQKITDIYATSVDYDVTAQATTRFFATVQNKVDRADANKESEP
jgi:hypothetical protein